MSISCALALFPLLLIATSEANGQSDAPQVRALFLGDGGHHRPAERAAQLIPALFPRGVRITYTEDLDVLSPEGLAPYDVLIVYANIEAIEPDQEAALLDFVASGKGLAPLHCASYCFLNSDAWVELVGAQFQRHGTGTFRTTITDRAHPITRGTLAFESWDETYVHHRHNPDRRVLSVRVDGEEREPWTWVREHGQGRVFYTAWGHDHRTWSHPGFLTLVERGIRWAAGDAFLSVGDPRSTPGSLEATIPNYRAGEHDASMAAPLEPPESMAYHATPAGFRVELFAAEPDIVSPLAMAWDERGRLWVVDSVDYPNARVPGGPGHDSIKILEDTDGDGRADHVQVFAEGLSIPTSLTFADGGVVVQQAPVTLFLRDTDGDDRADERRVLFEGWGTGDTHAGPSNLRRGLDNWIWGTVGYSAFRGRVGETDHRFGQGVYRFRSDGSELEFLGSTSNNTWGLGLSETGEVFVSTANNDQINYLAIPNRYYEAVSGWNGGRLAFIGDYREFHPITETVRQVDWFDRFTAAAGCALYTARSFPAAFWNNGALICEPTGHLVHTSMLERTGAGFVAHDGYNLFASEDEWCAPIAADVGPDGAVWVIDWYSYVVQHNPVPRDFEMGPGNAYVTPYRDKQYARIYRIVYEGASPVAPLELSPERPLELVRALEHENLLWRTHAQRLLVERGSNDVREALLARLGSPRLDGIQNDPGALHSLWTLAGLGLLDGSDPGAAAAVRLALGHPAAPVRKNVCQVLTRDIESREALLASGVLEDDDALVRREALLALSEMPASVPVGERLFTLLSLPENATDPWVAAATVAAAARHDAGFLAAALRDTQPVERAEEPPQPVNLITNPSFEAHVEGPLPAAWRERTYSGPAVHRLVEEGRGGGWCLEISSTRGSDTSWYTDVEVKPGGTYRLSGWVRTRDVQEAMGGLFNVHALGQTVTGAVQGDSDWRLVEVQFEAGGRESVSINCLFGGWGRSTGTVWYDDVSLVEVGGGPDLSALPETIGRAVGTVTRHYAARGPAESVLATLAALEGADRGLAGFVLRGLLDGWPAETAPVIDSTGANDLRRLLVGLSQDQRELLLTLLRRWNVTTLVNEFSDDVLTNLRERLADESLPAVRRVQAANRLLEWSPDADTVALILEHVQPQAEPELSLGLVQALSAAPEAGTSEAVLGHWRFLSGGVRRAAVGLLMRRPSWSAQLLDAVETGRVYPTDLTARDWQRFALGGDSELAARAERLSGTTGASSESRQELYEQLLPFASAAGDRVRGEEVFRELCSVCHTFAGFQGVVGPSLEGTIERSKPELLLEIVDPNRSLESNYQVWVVNTIDGEVLTGRVLSENRTTIELIDSEGQRFTLERAEIEAMGASNVSMMPEGLLDESGREDVAGLLEYLASGD